MVRLAGETRAYALEDVQDRPANDRLGGQPLVVLGNQEAMAAYVASADGRELTFEQGEGGEANIRSFVDEQTGSTWDLAGRAVAGPLAGAQLMAVPSRRAFWFSIAGSNPDIPLFER